MSKNLNKKANESLSKYKLLSAYGGPGSLMHTKYGSIIVSCIEEWGFIKKINQLNIDAVISKADSQTDEDYVSKQAQLEANGSIQISNDTRLLEALKDRKKISALKYLANVPTIDVVTHSNEVKDNIDLTISSSYMPKVFVDDKSQYKTYSEWYNLWIHQRKDSDKFGADFHPPKFVKNKETYWYKDLNQDNIVLLCEHGHISNFPWSKFLRWRKESPRAIFENNTQDLIQMQDCCNTPNISIKSNSANASGFDGKWLKCNNSGCIGGKGVSLKGIMGSKIKCSGHKPWEASTGDVRYHSGDKRSRETKPPSETCNSNKPMQVALTTGNNLYYANTIQSIYLHNELFKDEISLRIEELNTLIDTEDAKGRKHRNRDLIYKYEDEIEEILNSTTVNEVEELSNSEKEVKYRFDEFNAFHKNEKLLNKYTKDLKVKEVTENLEPNLKQYFKKILRVDQMKITSAQLDFSRVVPADSDAENSNPKSIFRSTPDSVITYPVVENFGEGIFFSFNEEEIDLFFNANEERKLFIQNKLKELNDTSNQFSENAINKGNVMNWPLYLVHSFSHLIMKELEFRSGYPTASLSERLYVSNEEKYKMYGCLIYTAEGSEGSMGGLIAQTRTNNLNQLIKNALSRATICNSDPLCWESEGQGLFDLNFASCFSCSLVSETSCEHSNLYLDRQILVDPENGFFKDIIN
jgi:hypothetical protein